MTNVAASDLFSPIMMNMFSSVFQRFDEPLEASVTGEEFCGCLEFASTRPRQVVEPFLEFQSALDLSALVYSAPSRECVEKSDSHRSE